MIHDIKRVKRFRKNIPVTIYEELTRQQINELQDTVFRPVFRYLEVEWTDGKPYRVTQSAKAVA